MREEGTREDTTPTRFGTVRPRVQIPGRCAPPARSSVAGSSRSGLSLPGSAVAEVLTMPRGGDTTGCEGKRLQLLHNLSLSAPAVADFVLAIDTRCLQEAAWADPRFEHKEVRQWTELQRC